MAVENALLDYSGTVHCFNACNMKTWLATDDDDSHKDRRHEEANMAATKGEMY